MTPPKTIVQFERAMNCQLWVKRRVPADETDRTKFKTTWTLRTDPDGHAHVEYAHGRLIVDFPKASYWFDLERLNESWPNYTWQRHLKGKEWHLPEHMRLLNELTRMFPPEYQP